MNGTKNAIPALGLTKFLLPTAGVLFLNIGYKMDVTQNTTFFGWMSAVINTL
jgi:hypothetical protein